MRTAAILFGRDRRRTLLTVIAAAALCVAGATATALTGPIQPVHPRIAEGLPVSAPTVARVLLVAPVVLAGLAAAWTAYLNDGVLPSATVAAGPQLGIVVVLATRGALAVGQGVSQTVGVAVGLGIPAFIVGAVVRRLRER